MLVFGVCIYVWTSYKRQKKTHLSKLNQATAARTTCRCQELERTSTSTGPGSCELWYLLICWSTPGVNYWFGARWFGFLGSPSERNCYFGVSLESQTTNPNHQLTISWWCKTKKEIGKLLQATETHIHIISKTTRWQFYSKRNFPYRFFPQFFLSEFHHTSSCIGRSWKADLCHFNSRFLNSA